MENKEYVKGQKMYSDRIGCYSCICDENFDNTTIINSPNCQKVKCNIEIHYADRLMAGCIPIYYGKSNCCPIDWRCRKWSQKIEFTVSVHILISDQMIILVLADPKDEIILDDENHMARNDTNMTCTFGSLVLRVGDKIKSEKYCVDCGCSMPPMMHCVQNGHCWLHNVPQFYQYRCLNNCYITSSWKTSREANSIIVMVLK